MMEKKLYRAKEVKKIIKDTLEIASMRADADINFLRDPNLDERDYEVFVLKSSITDLEEELIKHFNI